MITVSVNPSSSSAPRMAATRPSIMSEGATMSAPASACADRHLGKQLEGDVVVDLAVLDHAAVAMVRILAQADVGDDDQLRRLVLDGLDGHLHRAFAVIRAGP